MPSSKSATVYFAFSLLSLFIMCLGCPAKGQNGVISYPQTLPKEVVQDLQYLLQSSTGQRWDAQPDKSSNSGIVLSLNTSGNYKTGESCQVNSDGSTYVKFESPTTNGLIYGVYKYLRDLGFKFYLPDSLYTIIPRLRSVFKQTSAMETPFLRIRDFFGTGGFGSGKTDPGHNVQKDWQLWKWRNGFGAEFHLSGHVGETFNLANAKTLDQNPSWTATPVMKNGKVDVTTKLNYFNSDAVDFFTDWVIKKFTDKSYQPPPVSLRDMVSIEPADGGGFLTDPPAGSDLKTVSDQVYNAANVAAKKLDRLFPDHPNIGVNLYAYSTHADVPDFPLNTRVFVQLVPYQYQNIASGPAFIKRWSEKVKRFGIYDYFKYPDSYWDMPGKYTIDQLMERAINAAEAGSEGTTYESSYSKFSTAIPLWIVGRYMCSGDSSWQKNYDQFVTDLYGNAAPDVKNMFNIFYRQGQFGQSDLSTAVSDLQKAQQASTDARILQRLDELKLYLGYVALYLKSQDEANGDLEQRLLPLDKMIWTVYQKKIVDGYRLMQLISFSFLNAKTPDKSLADHYHQLHLQTFAESTDPNVLWKQNFSYSPNEIDDILGQQQAQTSRSQRRVTSEVSASPESLGDEIGASKSAYAPKQTIDLQGSFRVRGFFNVFAETPATIVVNWSLSNQNGEATATISGTDKDLKTVYDYPLKSASGKISISIPAGESDLFVNASPGTSYTLQLNLGNVYCFFVGSPRGKVNFPDRNGNPSYDPAYYPSFIYIPKNTAEVQYKIKTDALKIIDPKGNSVPTTLIKTSADGFQVRSFAVPSNQTGQFWQAIVSGNYNYQFINIPDRYFLFTKK